MSHQQETLQYRTCDHLKEDGIYCGSPALHGRNYCYYHLGLRGRRLARAQAARTGQPYRLQLPLFENMHAVQASLHEVMQSLADGLLDSKTAGLLLYGLQQAAANLNNRQWQGECRELRFIEEGRALDYPGFEEKFGIPQGIDLDADPEVALQEAEAHPETLAQPQPKPVPRQIPRAGLRLKIPHNPTWHGDDPKWEPTFEDLKREVDFMQGVLGQSEPAKKPPTLADVEEEEMEEIETA
jgi:hypothetical protein